MRCRECIQSKLRQASPFDIMLKVIREHKCDFDSIAVAFG